LKDGFEIAVANKLWIEKTIPVKEEFLLSTKTFFFSETSLADFSRSAAAESVSFFLFFLFFSFFFLLYHLHKNHQLEKN